MTVENLNQENLSEKSFTKLENLNFRIKDYSKFILGFGVATGRISLIVAGLGLLSVFATKETKELIKLVLKKPNGKKQLI